MSQSVKSRIHTCFRDLNRKWKETLNKVYLWFDNVGEDQVGFSAAMITSALLLSVLFNVFPGFVAFIISGILEAIVLVWLWKRKFHRSYLFIGNLSLVSLLAVVSLVSSEESRENAPAFLVVSVLAFDVFLIVKKYRQEIDAFLRSRKNKKETANSDMTFDPNASLDGVTIDDSPGGIGEPSFLDGATFESDETPDDSDAADRVKDDRESALTDDFLSDSREVSLTSRYAIETELGKGGMGAVLLAVDQRLNRKVAIKRVLRNRSDTATEAFLSEAQTAASLNHPNIVQVFDYGVDQEGPYLVMEYMNGGSLSELCRGERVEMQRIIDLLSQLCDGLSKAHNSGIIHRDIKPANVLLTSDGTPKLSDFGFAATKSSLRKNARAIVGTLDFMAPEQRAGASETDHRSDIYSLGATMYQLLTGRAPKLIKLDEVPKQFHVTLSTALEERKEDRFESVAAFKESLISAFNSTIASDRDLADGECSECGMLNQLESAFCRHCGENLTNPCLKCSKPTAAWNNACVECGANQQEILEELRSEQNSTKREIDELLDACRFAQAKTLADQIRDTSPPQLPVEVWYEQFAERSERRRNAERERAHELSAEADFHARAYDYDSAVQSLSLIPVPIRHVLQEEGFNINAQLSFCSEKAHRISAIETRLKEVVARGGSNDLIPMIDELLELSPNRPAVIAYRDKLWNQQNAMIKERERLVLTARKAYEEQSYARAIGALSWIKPEVLQYEDRELEQSCKRAIEEIQRLRQVIAERVNLNRLHGVIDLVDECLKLNAKQDDLINVKQGLLVFEQNLGNRISSVENHVQTLFSSLAFDQVLQTIGQIPSEEVSEALLDYQVRASELSRLQSNAIAVLEQYDEKRPDQHTQDVISEYERGLRTYHLTDSRFDGFHSRISASKKRRKTIRSMILLVGIGLVIAIGLALAFLASGLFRE